LKGKKRVDRLAGTAVISSAHAMEHAVVFHGLLVAGSVKETPSSPKTDVSGLSLVGVFVVGFFQSGGTNSTSNSPLYPGLRQVARPRNLRTYGKIEGWSSRQAVKDVW
jgi:hypothetical protein